jgi:hypothetical protein
MNTRDHSENVVLRKAFMLSTLLIETEMACKKQGVEFEVWNEDTIVEKGEEDKPPGKAMKTRGTKK